MKIVLASLNKNTIYTPLALLYCKAAVERDRSLSDTVKIQLKEFELDDSPEYVLWEIVKESPEIVAFSCFLWNIQKILGLSALIRQVLPGSRIILGGPEVSPRAKGVLKENPAVDVIVRGEGEFVFNRVVAAYAGGRTLSGVKGITWRKGRAIVDNPDQPLIADLDSVPSVYAGAAMELANREVCLETQRGCVFDCSFCYYNKGCKSWRTFSVARVKRELAYLLTKKDITIYLMDPVFNLDRRRAKEICRFIIGRNRCRIPFHTELQAELVDEELAGLLKKANMRYVEVGLQSSDEGVLAGVNRPFDRGAFVKGFTCLKESGLVVELQLILGLPGESLEGFERSLDFALELDPSVLSVFKLQVLPGTSIRERARSLGLEYNREPPYEFIKNRSMSFSDAVTAQKIVNSVSLFRRNPAAKAACRRHGWRMTQLIRRWLEQMPSDSFLLNGENNRALEKEAKLFAGSMVKSNT